MGIIPIHDATGRKQEAFMLHLDSVRRACEHLGIDNASQLTKLKNQQWATIVLITTVAEDGKSREQSMLHLDSVRRACEHLGIDYSGQHQKLNDRNRSPWSCACIIHAHDTTGRKRSWQWAISFFAHCQSLESSEHFVYLDIH